MREEDLEVVLWQDPEFQSATVKIVHKPSGITTMCTHRMAVKAKLQAVADVTTAVKMWEQNEVH